MRRTGNAVFARDESPAKRDVAVVDTPVLQYIVDEMIDSGVDGHLYRHFARKGGDSALFLSQGQAGKDAS